MRGRREWVTKVNWPLFVDFREDVHPRSRSVGTSRDRADDDDEDEDEDADDQRRTDPTSYIGCA